jgi:hypothetical protein
MAIVNNLATIRQKVRRLTRSPSEAQLTTIELDNYIDTFLVYDFPEHLRTFKLHETFTFTCNAFQDEYPTNDTTLPAADPLLNFENNYINIVGNPLLIAGFQCLYTQSREQFFSIYPKINNVIQIAVGDGVTTNFTGQLISNGAPGPNSVNSPILANEVLFSSEGVINAGLISQSIIPMAIVDVPNKPFDGTGILEVATTNVPAGQINYINGLYNVNFPFPPGAGVPITVQTVPYVPSRPQAMLYFDSKLVLRPVPDQSYRIQFEVFKRPTALLTAGDIPELEEWWQLIAYGAARKILQDRLDMETVNLIEPEYREQMRLCLRRTIVQYAQDRVATIYAQQPASGSGQFGGWGSGGMF